MAKRTSGFIKEANGLWSINTTVKVDGEYRHFKKRGYNSLSEAKADFERAKAEFIRNNSSKSEIMLYEELVKDYNRARLLVVSEGTQYMTMSMLHTYFEPYFKKKLLKDFLNKDTIKEWHANLVDNPQLSANRINKVIGTMKDLLKHAYINEYIDAKTYQSCDVRLIKIKSRKVEIKERVAWSLAELNQFFSAIPAGSKDYVMFKLFFALSPRISEFLALMPRCYDYTKKRMKIEQQVSCSYKDSGKQVLTNRLKTSGSYRTIALGKDTYELLEKYIADFNIKEDEFLFWGANRHTPYAKTTFRRRLNNYCDLAGVRRINPHGARHTMATLLAAVSLTGEDIEAAARRLGHSPEMFMNTYANHTNEKRENALLDKIGWA